MELNDQLVLFLFALHYFLSFEKVYNCFGVCLLPEQMSFVSKLKEFLFRLMMNLPALICGACKRKVNEMKLVSKSHTK